MRIADIVIRLLEVGLMFLLTLWLLPPLIDFFRGFTVEDDWPDDGVDRRGEK